MRRAAAWIPVAAWMALLWFLSTRSGVPGAEFVWDKLAHVVAYGALCLLCVHALHGGAEPLRPKLVFAGVLITLAYGALSELAQARVPGREASVADWVADGVGALAAIPVAQLLIALRRRPARRVPEVDG